MQLCLHCLFMMRLQFFIEGFRKFCYNEKSAEGTSYGVLKMRGRE